MALALAWFLTPLKLLRVPVKELVLTLLLSLRFMSLVRMPLGGLAFATRGEGQGARSGRSGAMAGQRFRKGKEMV